MAKIVIEYEFEKCNKCPFVYTERTDTPDSFECATDYYCGALNRKIQGYVESYSELMEVPNWCPYSKEN